MRKSLTLSAALALFAITFLPMQASADDVSEAVTLLNELGTGIEAAQGNCDKVAASIDAWVNRNGAKMRTLSAAIQASVDADPAAGEALFVKLGPMLEKMMAAMETCGGHPATMAAFERMDAVMDGGDAQPAAETVTKTVPKAVPAGTGSWGPECQGYFNDIETFCAAHGAKQGMAESCKAMSEATAQMKAAFVQGTPANVFQSAEEGCKQGRIAFKDAMKAMTAVE